MNQKTVGFAMCGSFCTFQKALLQMRKLVSLGYHVLPIMSQNAYSTDTRFGKAVDFISEIELICGEKIIHTIHDAEPIGPQKMCDVLTICPCTGNTLAKLCLGVTDTAVTMAAKSHLRTKGPLVIAAATNDALGASAQNIGRLLNTKSVYFVPLSQDDPINKPNSLVAHFDLLPECVEQALEGKQIQPIFKEI
ncbi:MAG: dipicolinate synthase subunit B [Bacillota bacterium]|nr:dipicolinate synthase subunit B [Bacillota bacterium]